MKIYLLSNKPSTLYRMKNNRLIGLFNRTPQKAWKQKVQYLLAGKDYEKTLIRKTTDGISILPYYTTKELQKKIVTKHEAPTKAGVHIEVANEAIANKKAIEAIQKGADVVFFSIHNSLVNLEILLKGIACKIYLQCLFLDVSFPKKASLFPTISLLIDPLGKLTRTGEWYTDESLDISNLKTQLKEKHVKLSINLATFHNAGASVSQQLAYTLSQLQTYHKYLKEVDTIVYVVAVGTDTLIEIAKLKALKALHEAFCNENNRDIFIEIIQHKSSFTLRSFPSSLNLHIASIEQQIGIQAKIDINCSIPNSYAFFEEDLHFTQSSNSGLIHILKNSTNYSNNALSVEKITLQLIERSLAIFNEISKGGGYLVQLDKGTIQFKIKENCISLQASFIENHETNIEHKTPKSYPFSKPQKYFTKVKPLLPKKWSETLEKPIWEATYQNAL